MKEITIGHLSHGTAETGGYLHEQRLMQALAGFCKENLLEPKISTLRKKQTFQGVRHVQLLWWAFINAKFDINIVVARCALSAILRNLFSSRKVIVVLHNFDKQDRKGGMLTYYYDLLFWVLRSIPLNNVSVCAVAPFWVNFFEQKIRYRVPVYLFPNLFDLSVYQKYRSTVKMNQIHLGQYSSKNDPQVFRLAERLTGQGYTCYFTTLFANEAITKPTYEVRFVSFEQYLQDMASSKYTLAFIGILEGWNRVAHESLLVETPVIGVNKGGLGDLLTESNSIIASTEDEFYTAITTNQTTLINPKFIGRYDISMGVKWVTPLGTFSIT